MRQVRRDPPVRSDPAPSRAAYRVTRLWLSPMFRFSLRVMLPMALVLGAVGLWIAQSDRRAEIASWALELQSAVKNRSEFSMQQIIITGAAPDLLVEIRDALPVRFPISWFDLDTEIIREAVEDFDAVKSAEVTLDLGGAVRVNVSERVPVALWRTHRGIEMLDDTGHRVASIDRRDGRPDLPLITGTGADRAVPEAIALYAAARPIAHRLRGLTRQGARRWDVVLDKGQIIQLPETRAVAALERVIALQEAQDILGRDVALVDIRQFTRPTVRLRPDALAYLQTMREFERGLSRQ
ncbi:MAG: cell division protein FtsQ/DivIB [Pseudomonadota bacterium]